ncbi:anaerobic carbon-monoxide dehydrogenase catalytic subunit [candidate division KSB1 bacterium]
MRPEDRSSDKASQELIKVAECENIEIIWDRYDAQQPQCGFGQLGICCRICNLGPCRIDPFGEGPDRGICGATVDSITARNLIRMIAAGSAAHSDHGRSVTQTLLNLAEGKLTGYKIKDEEKLKSLAEELGIKTDGRGNPEIAKELAEKIYAQFGQQHGELSFTARAPEIRREVWRKLGIVPRGIDREIVEVMHRTNMGVDNDPESLILHGMRTALSDGWGGSMIATELSDIMFGSPRPVRSTVNLGVLKDDEVNIVVHGHEPTLSDIIVAAVQDPELIDFAKKNGAKGINLAGICCTANEILMRHGVSIAGNFLQQELAITTGVVDLMVVDVQCIMPGVASLAKCFHTKVVSTSPKAKFSGVEHIEFNEEDALKTVKRIVKIAVENFRNRDNGKINIPENRMNLVAGFTSENIFTILGGKYRASYGPLNDGIISGRLRGAAAVVGCNNTKIKQDFGHVEMAKELLKNDIIIVSTGCSAIADAKAGLLDSENALEYCGKGLREICETVGIPPILHLGSCVDISRILVLLCNILEEGGLGTDISDLPVAAAAPEWMSEKAVAIGFYAVASGVFTVINPSFPVLGSKNVSDFIYGKIGNMVGANFAYEPDPVKAAGLMIEHINKKRENLKLKPVMYSHK